MKFNENENYLLDELKKSLENKTYKTSEYEIFNKTCGKKEREIYKLPFYPDRICQWAIMLQLEEIFISKFTKDTYSSIPNRGLHLALKRMQKEFSEDKIGMTYCLKIDIKKYYPNIDHYILKEKLKNIFKDNDLLWLLFEIIDSIPSKKGLPIGNYTSQYLSNFNLTSFDRWIKEEKKIKHYFRYMDDMCFFSKDKESLHFLLLEVKNYLKRNLKLELKGNEQIFNTNIRGVDFVGYVIYPNKTFLRKSIKKNMLKSRNLEKAKASYKGWLIHCNGKNLYKKHFKEELK